jgi:cytochrome P450
MATPVLDPLSVSFTADPHPILKTLRESDPVHFLEPFGSWVLTRYDDVRLFFGDTRVKRIFNSGFLFDRDPLEASTGRSPHSQQRLHERKAMTATCAPDAVARGMALIEQTVCDRLALLDDGDVVDVAPVLGAIPNLVVSRFFGVAPDEGDEEEFLRVTREAFRRFNIFVTGEERTLAEQALKRLHETLKHLIVERRKRPTADKAIDLFEKHGGEQGFDDEVIMSWLAGLIMAGSEATAQSAMLILRALLTYPDEADRLRRQPSLVPNAVLECLRFDLAGKFVPRIAVEDFTLHGRRIREGDPVLLSPTSAHRDPSAFADPDRLDVGRDTSNEMAFGRGPYSCIGAHLAVAELTSMVRHLLDIFPPGSYVLEDQLAWNPTRLNIRLLESLPIRRGGRAGRSSDRRDALEALKREPSLHKTTT